MNLFRFIDAERAYLLVSLPCRMLGVSRERLLRLAREAAIEEEPR